MSTCQPKTAMPQSSNGAAMLQNNIESVVERKRIRVEQSITNNATPVPVHASKVGRDQQRYNVHKMRSCSVLARPRRLLGRPMRQSSASG